MDVQHLVSVEANPKVDPLRPGDTVRVSFQVREGERVRTQAFEGTLIRRRGEGPGATFTVRRVSYGIGVERTVAWICGLAHLREAIPFPRMINRLTP